MREHKYRAWDSKNEVMYPEAYITDEGFLCIREGRKSYFDRDEGRAELMQYTGLNDKNGKEIYEGDVVLILYTDWPSNSSPNVSLEDYKKSISNIGKVVFESCAFSIQFNKDGYCNSIHAGTHGQIEVIGNIYENKELLGE